jgi:ribosomal protein L37E
MPLALRIPCPQCGKTLYHKRAGRCPACGGAVSAHVNAVRAREERIEKIVAVLGTALVILVFFLTSGLGLLEGIVMYAAAGAAMFYLAKKTFKSNRQSEE